jgi:hypothetical protein
MIQPLVLAQVSIDSAQPGISERKRWIEFDGVLVEGDGIAQAARVAQLLAVGQIFKRSEGGRSGLFQWLVKLLHGSQRLAQLPAQA